MIPALLMLALADAVASLLIVVRPAAELPIWLAAHLMACGGAGVIASLRAAHGRRDRILLGLLFSAMAAAVPLLGAGGLLVLLLIGLAPVRKTPRAPWEILRHAARAPRAATRPRPSPTALRRVLARRLPEHAEERFQAVLDARALQPQRAIGLFREALRDPSDEVRLFAFARIERMRSELETIIQSLEAAARASASPEEEGRIHLQLAQTYHEIAYLGLAEGAVLARTLQQAREHAERALDALPDHASVEWLLGRIDVALRREASAEVHFERALRSGFPRRRVVPYLAECAFRRRRFAEVRAHMAECAESAPDPRLWPLVETWR